MGEPLFYLGAMPVTPWALCVTLGSLAAAVLIWYLGVKRKISEGGLCLFVPLTAALSIFLGHALFAFVAGLLDPYVCENLGLSLIGYMFRPDRGGYMSLGVLGGLFLSALVVSKVNKASFQELLKAGLPGILLAIGVAKCGEWLCGVGNGPEAVTCFFPVSFTPEPEYPEWRVISVFWLGGLYALMLAIWGIVGAHKKNGVRPVTLFVLYLAGQVFWDILRREDNYICYLTMRTFIHMDQLFSVLIMAGMMVWATIKIHPQIRKQTVFSAILLLIGVLLSVGSLVLQGRILPLIGMMPNWLLILLLVIGVIIITFAILLLRKDHGMGLFRWWVLMLVSIGLCIVLQFMFDKPLPLFGELIIFPNWLVFVLIGLTAVGMAISTLKLLDKARKKNA